MNYIDIIGLGMSPNDLTQFHMELIQNCDVLVGGARHLSFFPSHKGQTITITKDIKGLIEQLTILSGTAKIVVLASGDPMFFGIGATLSAKIAKKWLRIHPNISSVAFAFSKIGQSWHDARILSLHSRAMDISDFTNLRNETKVALLTAPDRGPAYIARNMQKSGLTHFDICVLEHLGHPDRERVSWFSTPAALIEFDFSNPNIVVLINQKNTVPNANTQIDVSHETHLGLPDSFFSHTKGLITKSEIRVLSLSKLELTRSDHLLWDIGSGSGSVGIEAALMLSQGQVVAIEKNRDRIQHIEQNRQKLGLTNFSTRHADFPDDIDNLPTPDRIFVGGGGKTLETIISCGGRSLTPGGIMVVNTVVLENMTAAMNTLSKMNMHPEMIQVQINRASRLATGHRLTPLNPVWIISGKKPV